MKQVTLINHKVRIPKILLLFAELAIAIILLNSCAGSDENIPEVSYTSEVAPILDQKCAGCHGEIQPLAGLNLTTYEGVLAGTKGKPVLIPGDSSKSLLVKVVRSGNMPKYGTKLSDDSVNILKNWVDQGALDN